MSAKHALLILIIGIACILAAGCTQPAAVQQQPEPPAVTMTVPFGPIPVASTNGINIAYELELKTAPDMTLAPEKVEVIDPATGKVLSAADGPLLAALYHPAAVPPPAQADLMSGTGKVPTPRISIWFVVDPAAVPDRLSHRLTLNRSAAGLPALTATGGDFAVRKDLAPVVVAAPMSGPGWLAMETTSPETHHFSAQITMDGVTRVPQRYAQDWIYVDPATGQAAAGDAAIAKNYYGFGKEIRAVANGTVADAADGLPDIEKIYSAPPVTIATAAGNYVIVDLGNKKYACYAHMVNGSVRVKKGDVVKEGQVIGLLGNSGNSDIPHLHFQVVTDKATFLGSEGYPHVYRTFDVIGTVNQTLAEGKLAKPGYSIPQMWSEFGTFVRFVDAPTIQQERLPENNVIVRFP